VLVSGGDPLVLDNHRLDRILSELRSVDSIRFIRLNTRALTHNPFRFDADLASILGRHRIQAVEVQLAHPREFTDELDRGLSHFDSCDHRPLFLWRAPLIRGVNDTFETLQELMLGLYQRRITPYYLFHYAPFSPGRASRGVELREGVRLLSQMRRQLPGPAFPRYTLFHQSGKHDVPLALDGTPEFRYQLDEEGRPVVRFLNWKGQWVTYPDIPRQEA